MKPNSRSRGTCVIAVTSGCLIAFTWLAKVQATHSALQQDPPPTPLINQALTVSTHILVLDQTTRVTDMVDGGFTMSVSPTPWQNQVFSLNDLSRDMVLANENRTTIESPAVEANGQNVARTHWIGASAKEGNLRGRTLGRSTSVGLRQRYANVARALHGPAGSFPGVVKVNSRRDGKPYGAAGPGSIKPDMAIRNTLLFSAAQRVSNGTWIDPRPIDAVIHFNPGRHSPGGALALTVAGDQDYAMHPAMVWREQTNLFAGCITILFALMGLLLVRRTRLAHRREAATAEDRAMVAAANAQLEVAWAVATAKAEQLEATLGGMTDGVSMFDARMRLVEWNARFPEVAGVPADILRVGLPMEEILHAQIVGGQFGKIAEPEAEVRRRMLRLRTGPYGTVQRQRPDGHTLELRRKRLPDGGFVTLYADVTDHKRAEEALREAKVQAETAAAARFRFAAIVSHEIRVPLSALLNTLRALTDSELAPAQQPLLATARHLGDALFELTNDVLEMAQIETGKLTIRPSLFELQPLMTSSADMFAVRAAERGITVRISVAEKAPQTLFTDARRLRQVLLNLLSNAVEHGVGGEIRLEAETGRTAADGVTLFVKDRGPTIDAKTRSRLIHSFSRLAQPSINTLGGSGLSLSICQELVTLMGGFMGCESWIAPDGQPGNAFWLSLPASAVPVPRSTVPDPLAEFSVCSPRRRLPRTRILLVEDVPANPSAVATLLRGNGHLVDTVTSGQAAMKAVQRVSYDVVLMDTSPVGTRYDELTRAARALKEPVRSMPFISLTENVTSESKATNQTLEMNGVPDKPVPLARFDHVLRTHVWTGHRRSNACSIYAWALARAGSGQPEVIERDTGHPVLSADRILELRSNLAAKTFATLIEDCLVDLDSRLPALKRAFAAGSISAITVHSHAMVGMAAGYGMETLETSLRTVMSAARAGDTGSLGLDAFTQVERELASATRALRAMLKM